MLVAQFPKETENDYSKINLMDTPSHKGGGALCKYNQGLLSGEPPSLPLRVKRPGLSPQGRGARVWEGDKRCQPAARGKQDTERRGAGKADVRIRTALQEAGPAFVQGQGMVGGPHLQDTSYQVEVHQLPSFITGRWVPQIPFHRWALFLKAGKR